MLQEKFHLSDFLSCELCLTQTDDVNLFWKRIEMHDGTYLTSGAFTLSIWD